MSSVNPGEGGSLHHHRSGCLYEGACMICPEERGVDFTAVYFGESRDSGYVRAGEHRRSIVRKDTGNRVASFPCHLCQVRIKTAEVAFRQ